MSVTGRHRFDAGLEPAREKVTRIVCGALLLAAALTAAAVMLGGCLDPAAPSEGCANGESCDEDPVCTEPDCLSAPTGLSFAAILRPPESRKDLPTRSEVARVEFGEGGRATLAFEPTVRVSGRVSPAMYAELTVGARLLFRRRSAVPRQDDGVVQASSQAGIAEGPSYEAMLAPGTWDVLVVPDAGSYVAGISDTHDVASLFPPERGKLELSGEAGERVERTFDVELAGADYRWLSGTLLDAVGRPVAGMRAYARLPYEGDAPGDRVSTVTTTDAAGDFALLVAAGQLVDLVFAPSDGMALPTLLRRRVEILAGDMPLQPLGEIRLPSFPEPAPYTLLVEGTLAAGGQAPAVGALVELTTELLAGAPGSDRAGFFTSGRVGADGRVELRLLPGTADGNRRYVARVRPPAESPFAARVEDLDVGAAGGSTNVVRISPLAERMLMTGRIVDTGGEPVPVAKLALYPALGLREELGDVQYGDLYNGGTAQAQTDVNGAFALHADSVAHGRSLAFDLRVLPGEDAAQPAWSFALEAGAVEPVRALADLRLPTGAPVELTVVDSAGASVPGASVELFQLPESGCEDASCFAPALLRALAEADEQGVMSLALPAR